MTMDKTNTFTMNTFTLPSFSSSSKSGLSGCGPLFSCFLDHQRV